MAIPRLPLLFLPLALLGQTPQDTVPLKNWATPLYWQPTQAEREAGPKSGAQIQFSSNATSNTALVFVAVSPCRLVDTRGSSAGFIGTTPFNGPYIQAGLTVTYPVQSSTETQTTAPSPCGTIPSIAQAYSLNLTVFPHPLGTSVNYVTLWPTGMTIPQVSTLNDQQGTLVANAAIVPAGTPSGGINVFAYGATDVIIDMNGFYAAPTDLNSNTAIGALTLLNNTTGIINTAVGSQALTSNTTGSLNTAAGAGALQNNTTGSNNSAFGSEALDHNTTGSSNSATGNVALSSNTTGCCNTATGQSAMSFNTTGSFNTATGENAMNANTTGNYNTATGQAAMVNNSTGCCNTASGQAALNANTIGNSNAAFGQGALSSNTNGSSNAAFGPAALYSNSTACCNTAVGGAAMTWNTTGGDNAAFGNSALFGNTTGSNNAAFGEKALFSNSTACCNTAVGQNAMAENSTGTNNVALGYLAASNATSGNNNIHIGNAGASADSNVIKIGTQGTQTLTSIAGIYGGTPAVSNLLVCADANGTLGTTGCSSTPSSRRFKEQITDMGDASNKLLQLRPVTFVYKPEYDDGSHSLQYGLIAEEVAQLYPDMVGYGADGQPNSVKYQSLTPLLLNELQKQNAELKKLEERLAALEAVLAGPAALPAKSGGTQ